MDNKTKSFIVLSHQLYWYDAALREAQHSNRLLQELVDMKNSQIQALEYEIEELRLVIRREQATNQGLIMDNRALTRWIRDLLRE